MTCTIHCPFAVKFADMTHKLGFLLTCALTVLPAYAALHRIKTTTRWKNEKNPRTAKFARYTRLLCKPTVKAA